MQASLPTPEAVREAVREVYLRPEFRPPERDFGDWVMDQVARFVSWLGSLLGGVRGLEASAPFLFWTIVVVLVASLLAVVAHLVWTAVSAGRAPRRAKRRETPDAAPGRPRGAVDWEEEARRLAAAGRWREAAMALYAALLLRMDARDLLRFDPAKTPGDYRREVRKDPAAGRALGAFLRGFEPVAFGNRPLDAEGWRALSDAARDGGAHVP